jgi:hypothetical protein
MEEKEVGNSGESLKGLFALESDRFIAHVSACHHEAFERAVEQQMMQRGIGKHHPQGLLKRRNGRSNGGVFFPVEENDRPFRAAQERLFFFMDMAVRSYLLEIPAHDGKGLVLPELAGSQGRDGTVVFCVANQMKTPDPFDSHDRASHQKVKGSAQGISRNDFSPSIHQPQGGAASRAGIGLGVKPAVGRVLILPAADRAHRKGSHGCLGTVIRDVSDDSESRAAERAVDERIAVSEVAGREELRQAFITRSHIRRDQGKSLSCPSALPDFKTGISLWFKRTGFQAFDSSERRRKLGQPPDENFESSILTLSIDEDPLFIVEHPPPDGMQKSQIVNKGPIPDALNNAGYLDRFPSHNAHIL